MPKTVSPSIAPTRIAQVMDQVRTRIAARQLTPGEKLPSIRAQAAALGLSTSTVVEACERLAAEGLIRSGPGCGWLPQEALRRALRGLGRTEDRALTDYGSPQGLTDLRLATTFGGDALGAALVLAVLQDGQWRRHLDTLRLRLARARHMVASRLQAIGITPWLQPQGGLFLWGRLPVGVDASALSRAALMQGIALAPGNVFSAGQTAGSFMRFNVAQMDESGTPAVGVDGLWATLRTLLDTPSQATMRTPSQAPPDATAPAPSSHPRHTS